MHPFSDPVQLDTFTVISTVQVAGGFKHELFIRTATGAKYREELFAAPLVGVQPAKERSEELELLRVRMALSPDAFQTRRDLDRTCFCGTPVVNNLDLVYTIEPKGIRRGHGCKHHRLLLPKRSGTAQDLGVHQERG